MNSIGTKSILTALAGVLSTVPAAADHRTLLTQAEQGMSDAIASGNAGVWDKYLDAQVVYAEEDGSYKGKAEMLKEIMPLPKGLSGTIKVELLRYSEEGDTAVALFRQNEIEHYYGQTIHASYLTETVWKKRAGGWKQIAGQVLAERTDPPAIALPAAALQKFPGTYKLKDSEPTYLLTVVDGKLMGVKNGRKPAEWKPKRAMCSSFPAIRASARFSAMTRAASSPASSSAAKAGISCGRRCVNLAPGRDRRSDRRHLPRRRTGGPTSRKCRARPASPAARKHGS